MFHACGLGEHAVAVGPGSLIGPLVGLGKRAREEKLASRPKVRVGRLLFVRSAEVLAYGHGSFLREETARGKVGLTAKVASLLVTVCTLR